MGTSIARRTCVSLIIWACALPYLVVASIWDAAKWINEIHEEAFEKMGFDYWDAGGLAFVLNIFEFTGVLLLLCVGLSAVADPVAATPSSHYAEADDSECKCGAVCRTTYQPPDGSPEFCTKLSCVPCEQDER